MVQCNDNCFVLPLGKYIVTGTPVGSIGLWMSSSWRNCSWYVYVSAHRTLSITLRFVSNLMVLCCCLRYTGGSSLSVTCLSTNLVVNNCVFITTTAAIYSFHLHILTAVPWSTHSSTFCGMVKCEGWVIASGAVVSFSATEYTTVWPLPIVSWSHNRGVCEQVVQDCYLTVCLSGDDLCSLSSGIWTLCHCVIFKWN